MDGSFPLDTAVISWLRKLLRRRRAHSVELLKEKLGFFRELVERNDQALKLMGEAGEKLGGEYLFDSKYLHDLASELKSIVRGIVADLNAITGNRYPELLDVLHDINARVQASLESRAVVPEAPFVLSLDEVDLGTLDVVGEKMATLGELRDRIGLNVPDGFVISTHASREFLAGSGLLGEVEDLMAQALSGKGPLEGPAADLQERILEAELPRKLAHAIRRQVAVLGSKTGASLFAVRSSALGEDADGGTAGQFLSVLGVEGNHVCTAYREVVASLVSPSALEICRWQGIPVSPGALAVGILAMVPARTGGVVYSLDPMRPEADIQLVASTWGLGKGVVEGEHPVDRFEVAREPGFPVRTRNTARKEWMYTTRPGEGLVIREVSAVQRDEPSLSDEEVATVAEAAFRIERYMKCAQDIEWALDGKGELFVLQARPLTLQSGSTIDDPDLPKIVEHYPTLMKGKGEVVSRGIGSGLIHLVKDPGQLSQNEVEGRVLVAKTASPKLGAVVARAAAVITDVGSPTGHFAAVARELRVPTIVDAKVATSVFLEGEEVTVDAEENVVYAGRVDELLRYQLLKRSSFQDSREFRVLRNLLRKIAPLRLSDPQSAQFTPENCLTYHDVIRFAHEKAVAELTEIGRIGPFSGEVEHVCRLDLPIPLDLILIDLGDGIRAKGRACNATMDGLNSRPLIPLLEVLAGEGGWNTAPAEMDLDGFMSSLTRAIPLSNPLAARPEQNLAIVSEEYLHLSLRLGYHFNVVDSLLTDQPRDNYIYFRFAGGVTELTRRTRRAKVLRRILEGHGFVTEGDGDLVIGRVRGLPADAMVERMRMIGRLIGFARQLDIHMRGDSLIDEYVERFMGDEKDQ